MSRGPWQLDTAGPATPDAHRLSVAGPDAAATDEPDSSSELVIVETTASNWQRELVDLANAGEVNIKEVGVTVGGETATRGDVTIANPAIAARSAKNDWPTTGPASLWAGADNRIVELGRSESSLVLAIEVSQRFTGPLSRLAAQVINTTTFNDG